MNINKLATTFILLILSCCTLSTASAENSRLLAIEDRLQEQEASLEDIVSGAEKKVRWFNDVRQKTDLVLIYVHGFSASRQELSPTTEMVADKLGANTFYMRLAGHGRSDDAMAEGSVEKWQKDMLDALSIARELGDRTILISASTGGTLAMWSLAAGHEEGVVANILVSPNFGIKSRAARIVNWPGGLTLAKWINGDYNSFTPQSEKHGKYWTERYPLEAVVPMLDLVDDVENMNKSDITVPHLFIYSPADKVVDVDDIEETAGSLTSADVVMHRFSESTDEYQHVLSGDACSPESTSTMVDLMYSYIAGGFSNPVVLTKN